MTPYGGATEPGGANVPAAPGELPADCEVLLERTLPERQKLYRLVRRVLDELDEAAPWEQLYYPPDSAEAFLGMAAGLLGVVEHIPGRTRELVGLLSLAAPDDDTRQTLEEAEFFFAGIHSMCAHDLGRLRSLLEPYTARGGPELSPTARNFLCEVAADLKGKYASALMGATASIVAEGSWSGVEVEPVLFPEKAEEFRRNAELARGLRRALDAIGELRAQVPFPELLERWHTGCRADPYALADLATFRGILGQLLKRSLRRALYSGDYHQIQRREAALATRIAALEAIHHRTWSEPAETPGVAEAYHRLQSLALEIAAVLDAELLESLVGSRAFKDLRMAVAAERAAADEGRARRRPLAGDLEPLVPLLGGEDLKTFLALLLGSVLKRASLAAASRVPQGLAPAPAPPPPPAVAVPRPVAPEPEPVPPEPEPEPISGIAELLPSIAVAAVDQEPATSPSPPGPDQETPPRPAQRRPSPAFPGTKQLARRSASTAEPELPSPPVGGVVSERRRETLQRLHQLLLSLQSAANPHWSSFRMLQRLLDRHARIPPSIVQGAHPFVYDVLNGLVPQLEAAASFDAVPQEARRRLVECCLALTDDQLSPEQMVDEVPAHLARLHRLLEALTAATTAQLRSM